MVPMIVCMCFPDVMWDEDEVPHIIANWDYIKLHKECVLDEEWASYVVYPDPTRRG